MRQGNFYIEDNEYDLSAVVKSGKPDYKKISAWEERYEKMSVEKPFWMKVALDVEDAEDAYKAVLKHSGASKKRDDIDRRIIKEVKSGKATFKGSVTGVPGIIDNENDVLR